MWGKERKGTKQGEARGMRLPIRYELNNKLLALFKWALLRVLMSILLPTSFPPHFPLLWVLSSSQRTCPLYTCVHLKPPSLQPTQKKRRGAGILVHTCTCSLSLFRPRHWRRPYSPTHPSTKTWFNSAPIPIQQWEYKDVPILCQREKRQSDAQPYSNAISHSQPEMLMHLAIRSVLLVIHSQLSASNFEFSLQRT